MNWPQYFKYLKLLRPYTLHLSLVIIADFIVVNFGLIVPLFSKLLIDFAFPTKDMTLVNGIVMATILLYTLEFVLNVGSDYITVYLTQSINLSLTGNLFSKWQNLKLYQIKNYEPGDLILRLTDDISTVTNHVLEVIPRVTIKLYCLIGILLIALSMNTGMTLLALCSIPLYIFEVRFFTEKEANLEKESLDVESTYISSANETIENIKLVKASNQQSHETNKIISLRRRLNVIALKQGLVTIISAITSSFTIKLWSVVITWYMAYLVIQDKLTIGEVLALLTYFTMLDDPIKNLTELYRDKKVAFISMKRISEIIDSSSELKISKNKNRQQLNVSQGEIKLLDVAFKYPNQPLLLFDQLNLTITAKSLTAIVGDSGSGKSTLTNLILRFNDIEKGEIQIDGTNILNCHPDSVRKHIALVQQDYTLFKGSIRKNLLYGTQNATEQNLIEACRQSHLADLMNQFPDGLDHEIGYHGDGVSAGQRQRIAIARAILKRAPIIIFDEATSALDAESEYKISDIIWSLKGKVTIVVIAHRLSTIKKADMIHMMKDGTIIEQGCFEDLLEKRGEFFRFYNFQFYDFKSFKINLDMEIDRVVRYKNRFTLLALKDKQQTDNHEINKMTEVLLMLRKQLRKADQACVFDNHHILLLLPEITTEQVLLFTDRISKSFQSLSLHFSITGVHVKSAHFKVSDDIIARILELQNKNSEIFLLEEY